MIVLLLHWHRCMRPARTLVPDRLTGVLEHSFPNSEAVSPEDRFTQLRLSAACAPLSRDQISELVAITANLFEERKRIRRVLERLPPSFAEVRALLNELNRTVR